MTIDTIPPATPSKPVLAAASDSGSSNSDQITNITSVQISGTAEPGATALIFNDRVLDIQTVNATGLWQSSVNLTVNGLHSITVLANDVAGNTSYVTGDGSDH